MHTAGDKRHEHARAHTQTPAPGYNLPSLVKALGSALAQRLHEADRRGPSPQLLLDVGEARLEFLEPSGGASENVLGAAENAGRVVREVVEADGY